ncbi:MAG: M28 family peptidase, partial [Phycisphaerales bacterium]
MSRSIRIMLPMTLATAGLAFVASAEETDRSPRLSPAASAIAAERLRAWHELVAFEPQVAGTEADHRSIERIDAAFDAMGLASDPWWFRPLLAYPVSARLEIVEAPRNPEPERADGSRPARRGVVPLPIRERNLLEDPATAHPDLSWGWNAFSGSGEVEAEVVYVNQGLEADYAQLRDWGVDVSGKIVLARYGGAYRGHKVRNAEANGAAGVLLFTDPADAGFVRGKVWPEGGGWANETCIQRGSVLTREQPGDVLTPFEPAFADAPRIPVEEAGLFTVPVQPIGYAAANEILRRMSGREVASLPGGERWQGGLDLPYRVEGGESLRLRLAVEQERRLADTANVIAVIEGSEHPEQRVVIGCHHDAWGFGAADPHSGTIALLEVARGFGALAAQGIRPKRTLVFAAWGAEEYGIIGSTEWVEAERDRLAKHGVAYLNLDMASMGPNFSMSASPSLRNAARRAAAMTPAARDAEGRTVLELAESGGRTFSPGGSGGGSDHVAFVGHVAMPVATIHSGGSEGTSYHTNYDTLAWYRSIVGEDYEPALMIARYTANLATLLAFEAVLPIRTEAVARDAAAKLRAIPTTDDAAEPLAARLDELADRGTAIDGRLDALAAEPSALPPATLESINAALLALDRVWWDERGLFDRPWYRNLSIATDRFTGYGSTAMPIVAEPVADGDADRALEGLERLEAAIGRLEGVMA